MANVLTTATIPTCAAMLNNISELAALQSSFNEAINVIRTELHDANLPELSIYTSEPHPLDDPSFLCSSKLHEARKLALASIGQLKVMLQMPYEKVIEQSCAVYDTASLDIFIKTGILDKLLESENLGVGISVSILASHLDLDPVKLVAILRYLAVQGWVYERQESVFCLTRIALELRKGSNGRKWALTPGKPKVALSLLDQMTHPQWRYSNSPAETAFQLSHNTSLTLFQYLKQHPDELKQWASSVRSYGDAYQAGLLRDYPWDQLGSTSLVVDCGGGQGYLTMALAKRFPRCKFVIQDLPEVVEIARANLEIEMPEALKNHHIITEAHSFFDVQPPKPSNTAFVFRYILHDWPDADCVRILKNTVAMNKQSKILIIEYVGASSTPSPPNVKCESVVALDDLSRCGKHRSITPPAFIPANFGANAKSSLAVGVHMMGVFNARERSINEWRDIIDQAGLVIAQVHSLRANVSVIECKV